MKLLQKIVAILLILVAIVSCIKWIYEPDIWWQIATGNWIIENGKVPVVDMFSYSYAGDPWINVKWGSEVLMAMIDNTLGVEFLPILQIVCLLLILFFTKKIFNFFSIQNGNTSPNKTLLGFVWATIIALFIVNFRLNSRPEMFSHLFTIIAIYLYVNHKRTNSNQIYWLIPLQILWTNMHEAYGVGMIISVIFIVSFWLEHKWVRPKYETGISFEPIKMTIAVLASILAIGINPHGFKMILHPFTILGQLSDNKYTNELISVGMEGYWQYQSIFMVIITLFLLFKLFKKNNYPLIIKPIAKIGLGYSIVLAAFLYLSLTSFRNIPFFIFVATPLLAYYFSKIELKSKDSFKLYLGTTVLLVFFYGAITTNYFYKKLLPVENYGLMINSENNPIGAANFIKDNNIKGNGFVDYLSSSYFIYSDTSYKSLIDLRDLDVFEISFFDYIFSTYQNPEAINYRKNNGKSFWAYLEELDNYNYVVILNSPEFRNMNQFFMHRNKDYELVYADNLNSIYLKNIEKNSALIKKYGYATVKQVAFHPMARLKPNETANTVSKIFWPFYKPKTKLENRYQAVISDYLGL